MTTIKLKNGSGAPTSGDLAQGEPALDLTNKRLYTEDSGGTVIEVGTNPGVDVTFADNRKAVFGAGSDLQIYHDGSNSYVSDQGTGNLRIYANDLVLANNDGSETFLYGVNGGAVSISYANSAKLATTSTGIDVTGSISADGLTVDSSSGITVNGPTNQDGKLNLVAYAGVQDAEARIQSVRGNTSGTDSRLQFLTNNGTSLLTRVDINDNGDISFYEDTGTTAKLFWDASAESLGIGTSSPSAVLDIQTPNAGSDLRLTATDGSSGASARFTTAAGNFYVGLDTSTGGTFGAANHAVLWHDSAYGITFATNNSRRMTIDSSGNLLVGKTASVVSTVGHALLPEGQHRVTADGAITAIHNRLTSDGDIIQFRKDGTAVGSIGTNGGDLFVGTGDTNILFADGSDKIMPATTGGATRDAAIDLGTTGGRFKDLYLSGLAYVSAVDGSSLSVGDGSSVGLKFVSSGPKILPRGTDGTIQDGTIDLGDGNDRFQDIYATNGTIQTSDRNEKQDIAELSDAEQRVAVACKGLLRKFRWKSAVEDKGDEARIHFGIIAQDLQDAFTAEGLDAGRYAMFINSTWTDEETGEERSRMGVRYSELLAFIIAAI